MCDQVKSTENILQDSYGGNTPLKLFGKTKLNLQTGQSTHSVEFQVIKGKEKPLLGVKLRQS